MGFFTPNLGRYLYDKYVKKELPEDEVSSEHDIATTSEMNSDDSDDNSDSKPSSMSGILGC